jgi:2-C-methyl-D-erythritol 4-phosphate cytidylyltransferase
MKKTQLILLSGGSGVRFGGSIPKQYVKIAGKTILEHTIQRVVSSDYIDSIIIVVHKDYYDYVNALVLQEDYMKVKKVIVGGKTRQESSYAGLCACDEDTENVLLHDAIRPFISEEILKNTVMALDTYDAVDVVIPCSDTIVSVENDLITGIPNRNSLRRGQTPQGFKLSLIKQAYERYMKALDITVSDDCGLIVGYHLAPVFTVRGEEQNIKITYKEDAYLADKLFQVQSNNYMEETICIDALDFVNETVVLFGSSSGIGEDMAALLRSKGANVFGYSRENGVDISNFSDVCKALELVSSQVDKIDYVINTAGLLNICKLEDMDISDMDYIIATNYIGAVNVTKAAIPYLEKSKGMLLLFTSSSYTRGRATYSIYSSSKAAVVNFMQAVSEEVYDQGIRINAINPERTNTPMRVKNFGLEPKGTLLDKRTVSEVSIHTLKQKITGQVIDVRRKISNAED